MRLSGRAPEVRIVREGAKRRWGRDLKPGITCGKVKAPSASFWQGMDEQYVVIIMEIGWIPVCCPATAENPSLDP
jgi:hypothetical protein